jgi:hypothetical protein
MSDLVFTAPGAANGLSAPVGAVTRCVSILLSHLSLSLSLSLGGVGRLLGPAVLLPS